MEDIKYTLRGVSIEQFATPFVPTTDDLIIRVNIPIKTNYNDHTVAIGANIQFLENDRVSIVAEVFCHYVIEPECWKTLSENDSKEVILPKDLVRELAGIAISTSRGVLAAKTDNTPFAKYFLPLVMINPNAGSDLIIKKPE